MLESGVGRSFPQDMQYYLLVGGVGFVTVATPAAGLQIDFYVADQRGRVADLNDGAAKIRARFLVPEPGMNDAQALAVDGFEVVAEEALVMPNLLEQALGR